MSSDWIREHKETIATKVGAPMAWWLCCLLGKERGVVSLMLLGGFQCLRTGLIEHKERNATKGGAPMAGCWCCLQS